MRKASGFALLRISLQHPQRLISSWDQTTSPLWTIQQADISHLTSVTTVSKALILIARMFAMMLAAKQLMEFAGKPTLAALQYFAE